MGFQGHPASAFRVAASSGCNDFNDCNCRNAAAVSAGRLRHGGPTAGGDAFHYCPADRCRRLAAAADSGGQQAARAVLGVVSVKPRIWGIVNGPDGPLTIIGVAPGHPCRQAYKNLLPRLPGPGQAIVGPGVAAGESADILQLEGAMRGTYQVIGRLPDKTGIFTHDLVLLNAQDARRLISLPDGYASDLAVEVFHEEEAGRHPGGPGGCVSVAGALRHATAKCRNVCRRY